MSNLSPGAEMKTELSLSIGGIPNRGNVSYPSGRIWPDGTFSLGYVRDRPDERLDERPPDYCAPGDEGTEAAPALDLRNLPNSDMAPRCSLEAGSEGSKTPNRPERYGRKGITGYGRKVVRSVGALIDRNYPHHRVTFCTITMPTLPQELRVVLAQEWPKLVNELLKWITRRLVKRCLPEVIVAVTEIQPKRLEEYGEGYLHLHLLWLNEPAKAGHWAVDVLALRSWVSDWLIRRGLWERDSHCNVDVRSVKGEKSRYLAKYASKGSAEIEAFASDCGWDAVPSQWWNCTHKARRWVKDNTFEGRNTGRLLEALIETVFDNSDFSCLHYIYHVDIHVGPRLINVGWRGCLEEKCYKDVTGMLQNC